MFCPYCATQVKDGAAFCPRCGKALALQPSSGTIPQATAGTRRQAHIGAPVQAPANAYPQMPGSPYPRTPAAYGQPQNAAYQQTPTSPYYQQTPPYNAPAYGAPAKKSRAPLVVAIVLIALLALAAAFVFFGARGCSAGSGIFSTHTRSPENAATSAVESVKKLDLDGLLDSVPEEYVQLAIDSGAYSSRRELVSALDGELELALSNAEEELRAAGINISVREALDKYVSTTVGTSTELDPTAFSELKESINWIAPGLGSRIEQAASVPVTISIEGIPAMLGSMTGVETSGAFSLITGKIDGKWYVVSADMGFGLMDYTDLLDGDFASELPI